VAEHLDQRIDAEAVDLAAGEVADPRLRYTEEIRGCGLGEPSLLQKSGQLNHEIGANPKILGLFALEAEVLKHVSAGLPNTPSHLALLPSASLE
jgi:hypothetical protein